MTTPTRATVAVIGGGPAGASAALELASLGIETVVIERSDGGGNPVGECLAPSANPLFRRPGFEGILHLAGALPSHGNRSSWGGTGTVTEYDFLREPLGHGWHLDRQAFNRALLDAVEAAGVSVWREHRAYAFERTAGGWQIEIRSSDGGRVVDCDVIVDASGRRGVMGRRAGFRRRALDPQVAAVAYLQTNGQTPELHDATTTIEAAAGGWWYAALLPTQRLAVAWFTDPDLLAEQDAWRPGRWWAFLGSSELVGRLVAECGYVQPERIEVLAAGSSLLGRPYGVGWIAAGDAAAAYDPLSSHGIGSALASGRRAAQAVAAALDGDDSAFPAYRDRLLADYARYLWTRHAYYMDEQRWPREPFWERRHGRPANFQIRSQEPIGAGAPE